MCGKLLSLLGFWNGSSPNLFEYIKPKSEYNAVLHHQFMSLIRPILPRTLCVFEAAKESIWGFPIASVSIFYQKHLNMALTVFCYKIVDKESAIIDGSQVKGFDKSHRNIHRFSSQNDIDYRTLVHYIQSWMNEIKREYLYKIL